MKAAALFAIATLIDLAACFAPRRSSTGTQLAVGRAFSVWVWTQFPAVAWIFWYVPWTICHITACLESFP